MKAPNPDIRKILKNKEKKCLNISYILPAYRRNQLYGLSKGEDLYSKRGIWLVSDTFSETGD